MIMCQSWGFLIVEACFANMHDLSLCFLDHLCLLECLDSESESEEEVPDDSPKGSLEEWSEDASYMSRHCLFCSESWNQGWLCFLFLEDLDCFSAITTGAIESLAGVSSSWSKKVSTTSSSACWSHWCWLVLLDTRVLEAVEWVTFLPLDFENLLCCQKCANCSSVSAICEHNCSILADFCAFWTYFFFDWSCFLSWLVSHEVSMDLSEMASLSSASNLCCDTSSSTKLSSTTIWWAGTGEISCNTQGVGGDLTSSSRECPAKLSVPSMSRSESPDNDGVGDLTHTCLHSTFQGAEWPWSPRPKLPSKWSGTCLSISWKWAGFWIVHDAVTGDEPPVCLVTGDGKQATVPADLWLVTFLPDPALEWGDRLATSMLPVPAVPLTSDEAATLWTLLDHVDTEFLPAFAELRDLEWVIVWVWDLTMAAPCGFWLVSPVEVLTDFWLDFLMEWVFLFAPHLVADLPMV